MVKPEAPQVVGPCDLVRALKIFYDDSFVKKLIRSGDVCLTNRLSDFWATVHESYVITEIDRHLVSSPCHQTYVFILHSPDKLPNDIVSIGHPLHKNITPVLIHAMATHRQNPCKSLTEN